MLLELGRADLHHRGVVKQLIPTPEGVPIEVELAGLGSRTLALLLDCVILIVVLMLGFAVLTIVLAFAAPQFIEDFASAFALRFSGMAAFLILWAMAVLMDGTTPGKRSLGLRVIGADGQPASAWQHLLRAIALPIDLFLFVGPLLLFFGQRPRRLGDLAAGTIVVRDAHEPTLLDPWLKATWNTREARSIELTPGLAARFDEADLALLRDIILRRDLEPNSARELHREAAIAYCKRSRTEPTADPRRALKDIFLFLRESRGL